MFTKKHYEMVADLIDRMNSNHPEGTENDVVYQFANKFADEFYMDNPNFDHQRFIEACGFEE